MKRPDPTNAIEPNEMELVERLVAAEESTDNRIDPLVQTIKTEIGRLEARLRSSHSNQSELSDNDIDRMVAGIEKAAKLETVKDSSASGLQSLTGHKIGEYQLMELLGQGGMGAVYQAKHRKLDRLVAIKVLSKESTKDVHAVARFEREMRAVGRLQHRHLVAAHDAGEFEGTHYLVMELINGIDLSTLAKRKGPLRQCDACEIIRQAAMGLQHAFEQGLVHRDVKPSNIMLAITRDAPEPIVKVLDLGLARLEAMNHESFHELTLEGQIMGTVDYMAPEQSRDTHDVDIRADIYSLGATLYRLLCGQAPFSSDRFSSITSKLIAIQSEPVRDPRVLRPDCPELLANLVLSMLSKDPQQRPNSPLEVANALAPLTRGSHLASLLTDDEALSIATSPGLSQVGNPPHPIDSSPSPVYVVSTDKPSAVDRRSVGGILLFGAVACVVLAPAIALWMGLFRDDDQEPSQSQNTSLQAAVAATDQSTEFLGPSSQSLEEWLEGREVLTVAKTGRADYRSIQAALNDMKPGQVVEVLDEGPYEENLILLSTPENSGLISRVSTRIQARRIEQKGINPIMDTYRFAHRFEGLDGFRMSGIFFIDPQGTVDDAEVSYLLRMTFKGDALIEKCVIMASVRNTRNHYINLCDFYLTNANANLKLKENWLEGRVNTGGKGTALLSCNYFADNGSQSIIITDCDDPFRLDARFNVFDAEGAIYHRFSSSPTENLRFVNNTFLGHWGVIDTVLPPTAGEASIVFSKNIACSVLHTADRSRNQAKEFVSSALTHDHNVFVNQGQDWANALQPSASDVVIPDAELPIEPSPESPRFARVMANHEKMADLGVNVGALPLGPPPSDGDWLTRLCARGLAAKRSVAKSPAK